MAALDSLRRLQKRPILLLAGGFGVLVMAASLWLGFQARRVTSGLVQRQTPWKLSADQLATVQQRFRVPTSTESSALIAESARMGSLGIPESHRVSVLDLVGRLAEASTLRDVRVNVVTKTDTVGAIGNLYVPPRAIGTDQINAAPYAITLDFTGSFVGLVQFVSSLPPSLSVSKVAAGRYGSVTEYHVVLSVYQLNANAG